MPAEPQGGRPPCVSRIAKCSTCVVQISAPDVDKGHILARQATTDSNCKAPANFDCAHSDRLYVFQDATGSGLKADYFDNEGHVIHLRYFDANTDERYISVRTRTRSTVPTRLRTLRRGDDWTIPNARAGTR